MDVDVDGDGIAQGSLDGEDGGGKAMGTGKGKGKGRSSEYEDELLMLERLARGETGASHRIACWCAVSGLTAVPAPRRSHADNTSPAILLSYPLAPASSPSSSSSSSSPAPSEITFALPLPEQPPPLPLGLASTVPHNQAALGATCSSFITHLSFSPDGGFLAAVSVTQPPSIDASFLTPATRSRPSVRLTIFRKLDCINTWECIADWEADRARAATGGLGVGKVVDARWLGAGRSGGGRDLLASHGGNTFVAVLDTQECLVLHLASPDSPPTIIMSSLASASTDMLNIYFSGTALAAPLVDAMGNLLPPIPPLPPARLVRHAAISESMSRERGDVGRVLVAYTSQAVLPPPDSSATLGSGTDTGLDAPGSIVQQLTGLPDPFAPATGATSATMQVETGMGTVQLPAPSATSSVFDANGGIDLSALDEMFDASSGLAASSDFLNSSTLMGMGGSFDMGTQMEQPAPVPVQVQSGASPGGTGQKEVKIGSESPSKSMEGSVSPRKGAALLDTSSDSLIPEKLADDGDDGQSVDAAASIEIWEILIRWDSLSVTSSLVKSLPVHDLLEDVKPDPDSSNPASGASGPAVSTSETITHLSFLPNPRADKAILCAILASSPTLSFEASPPHAPVSTLRTWQISRQAFSLSDAFKTLEGRKKDPPSSPPGVLGAASAFGSEWVVAADSKAAQDTLVVNLLCGAGGQLYSVERSGHTKLQVRALDSTSLLPQSECPPQVVATRGEPQQAETERRVWAEFAFPACDSGLLVGRPAIFPLPRVGRKTEDGPAKKEEESSDTPEGTLTDSVNAVGRAIAGSLASRCSAVDALILIQGKSLDERKAVMTTAWQAVTEGMRGLRIEQSALLMPFISLQQAILPAAETSSPAKTLIQLVSMQRLLQSSRMTLRQSGSGAAGPQGTLDAFDLAAMWPIIGHILWLFELWDRLTLDISSSAGCDTWATSAFLLVHPLPRAIQQRLIRLIARFAGFVMSPREAQIPHLYPPSAAALVGDLAGGRGAEGTARVTLDVEVARSVLGDMIVANRTKTQEWNTLLQHLQSRTREVWSTTEPADLDRARDALVELRLPDELRAVADEARTVLMEKLRPLAERQQPQKRQRDEVGTYDAITRAALSQAGAAQLRMCQRCGECSQMRSEGLAVTEWEASKRRSCICGGSWYAVASQP